jgi:hypothetical protein
MKENIYYSSREGQEFQKKPHISILPSQDFPETWQVDLRWREDNSDVRIDAQCNIRDGSSYKVAFVDAINMSVPLNVPVVIYKEKFMYMVRIPDHPSTLEDDELQRFIRCNNPQRFLTH